MYWLTEQPIPYWLYKLHGLNIYYECEICGGYKYRFVLSSSVGGYGSRMKSVVRGPKAFQRHFSVSCAVPFCLGVLIHLAV